MHALLLVVVCFWNFSEGFGTVCMRVVGGSLTTIENYPSATVILLVSNIRTVQICGGTILNERNILTAAHCSSTPTFLFNQRRFIIRVGSSMANSGGTTHRITHVFLHPKWNRNTLDSDVAIMRTATAITYSKTVQPANLAGATYRLYDNESVWAVGWGFTSEKGEPSEQLRHVNLLTVNTDICRSRFLKQGMIITDNMLCAGWLDVGGRDQCISDSGSPVYHHNTVVGFSSLGYGCGKPCYPGVNVRVSRFESWIKALSKPENRPNSIILPPTQIVPSPMGIEFDIMFSAI